MKTERQLIDKFAKGMDEVEQIAKSQGCKTKKDVASFVIGYAFGFGHAVQGKSFGGKKKRN